MTATVDHRPIRVLHVAQATITGLAVRVINVAGYQHEHGMDVTIACPEEGSLATWARERGIRVIEWQATRSPGPSIVREVRALRRIIDDVDPDVVHLASSKAGLCGRLALRGRRPTLFTPDAWSFLVPGWTRVPSLLWERVATRWTSTIVVSCEEEAQAGRDAGIFARYDIAEHGVDPDRFWFADADARSVARKELGLPDGPTAVCVGRLCYQKGQKPLIQAWAEVERQVPEATLVLVGAGEDEAELRAHATRTVLFVGAKSETQAWFSAADVVVQPSRYEALSFSTLEAMSVGRSVVAFDAIGMRTAIGEEAGDVVPMDDEHALAGALIARLQDPELAEREGKAGRARVVERFTLERFQQSALRIIEEHVARDGVAAT